MAKKTTNTTGLIPPQALEIEQIFLAGLMTQSDAFEKVQAMVSDEVFYIEQNRIIYQAVQSLSKKGKPIDLITVCQYLKDSDNLEQIGGIQYLMNITSKSVLSFHIEHHAQILLQKFIQRELIKIGTETARNGFDDTMDIDDQLTILRNKITNIENLSSTSILGKDQNETILSAVEEIEEDCRNFKSGKPAGINTGLNFLNGSTGGWRPTNLIIIASRPGVGKTSLAIHFAKIAARTGTWVNFYGLEMTSEDLMRIMISSESEVDRIDIRDGRLNDQDWGKINLGIKQIEDLPIIWNDNAGITAQQISANTRKNAKKGKCGLVIIDYLQLITPSDKRLIREQQISDITRTLKKTALEMKVPIILLSQLNREASETKPQLHHLRESGAIEQDADVVIMPWRDSNEKYQIIIAKNRRGQTGMFEISVNNEMTRFDNIGYSPKKQVKTTVVQNIDELDF